MVQLQVDVSLIEEELRMHWLFAYGGNLFEASRLQGERTCQMHYRCRMRKVREGYACMSVKPAGVLF